MPTPAESVFRAAQVLLSIDHIHQPSPRVSPLCFYIVFALSLSATFAQRSGGLHSAEDLSPFGYILHPLCLTTQHCRFSRSRLRCYLPCSNFYRILVKTSASILRPYHLRDVLRLLDHYCGRSCRKG